MAPRAHPPFRSILCGVDFSAESAAALRHAAAVAREVAGDLTVVYVNDPLLLAAAAAGADTRSVERTAREELQQFVQGTLGRREAHGARCLLESGAPAPTLLAAAGRRRADLIVLGTQGLSGVRRLFFGSTTLRVLQTTSMPVLAVPPVKPAPRRRWLRGAWVVPLDLGAESARELRAAARLAAPFGAALFAVHVVHEMRVPAWLAGNRRARLRAQVLDARERLGRVVADANGTARVQRKVLVGSPAETIAGAAREAHADLLVMTLRGPSRDAGQPRARPGAVAYDVLSRAPAPVLALPPAFVSRLAGRGRT
ncbi:MAG TPA: universal stress protein [Vicinamibacterales bacterium]|nr:universal stress protein [Vicinamibacterales bacterium]